MAKATILFEALCFDLFLANPLSWLLMQPKPAIPYSKDPMQIFFEPYSISLFYHHQTEIKNLDIQGDTVPSEPTNQSPLSIIHQYIAHIIKLYNRELKSYVHYRVS